MNDTVGAGDAMGPRVVAHARAEGAGGGAREAGPTLERLPARALDGTERAATVDGLREQLVAAHVVAAEETLDASEEAALVPVDVAHDAVAASGLGYATVGVKVNVAHGLQQTQATLDEGRGVRVDHIHEMCVGRVQSHWRRRLGEVRLRRVQTRDATQLQAEIGLQSLAHVGRQVCSQTVAYHVNVSHVDVQLCQGIQDVSRNGAHNADVCDSLRVGGSRAAAPVHSHHVQVLAAQELRHHIRHPRHRPVFQESVTNHHHPVMRFQVYVVLYFPVH